ncbi:hypothetical protein LCGC14_0165320 [marine sediment metagenome]|uniref:Methyltransferase type 11 domain-containing protein n=1 Tax=marine sediment metagenome TaxID=412755 RepID=A0A0F9XWW4_9ZZZZ
MPSLDLDPYLDHTVQTNHDNIEKFDGIKARGRTDTVLAAKDLIHSFLPRDGESVVDIGIAGGYSTRELGKIYKNVTGVSICQEDVDHAAEHGVHAVLDEMHKLETFEDSSLDGVFASHILEHSPAPYIALRTFFRVLKPDGWVVIVMPERDGIAGRGMRRFGFFKTHLFCADPSTVIYLLRRAEFRLEWYREVPQWDPRFVEPNMYHQVYCARKGREVRNDGA